MNLLKEVEAGTFSDLVCFTGSAELGIPAQLVVNSFIVSGRFV
jgi:hypothetical protein